MGAMIDELTEMLGVKVDVITHAILDARGRGGDGRCRQIYHGGSGSQGPADLSNRGEAEDCTYQLLRSRPDS